MRHRNKKIVLNRPADQRKALMRSLVTQLFQHGKIKTTLAKSKLASISAEKLLTKVKRFLAKGEKFNAIRELQRVIFTEEASKKALEYAETSKKTSGYVSIVKGFYREGDNALIAHVELIKE